MHFCLAGCSYGLINERAVKIKSKSHQLIILLGHNKIINQHTCICTLTTYSLWALYVKFINDLHKHYCDRPTGALKSFRLIV